MNQITVVGNLVDDPELRYTPNGVAVATCRVAVNRRRKDGSGEWQDGLDGYFTAVVWRDCADHVADSLHKGDRVLVTGRLTCRSYEDTQGQTRWVAEIQAEEICPSLRWAQAKVMRITNRAEQGPGVPPAAPAPAGPSDDDLPF